MVITRRDMEILEFIQEHQVVTTSVLEFFFFKTQKGTCKRAAQERLRKLTEGKHLKRVREGFTNEYIYYVKKPNPHQMKHFLKIADLHMELAKKYPIVHFKVMKKIGNVIPDMTFGFIDTIDGKKINQIGFLEVEMSNNGLNVDKYFEGIEHGDFIKNKIPEFRLFYWRYTEAKLKELPLE